MMTGDQNTFRLVLEGSVAEKGQSAEDIVAFIGRRLQEEGVSDHASLQVERDNPRTQDFGTSVLLILGTPAIIAIAKGLRDWIAKRGSSVRIVTPEGTVIATGDGVKNLNVEQTVQALRQAKK